MIFCEGVLKLLFFSGFILISFPSYRRPHPCRRILFFFKQRREIKTGGIICLVRVAESNYNVTVCCSLRTVDFVANDPVCVGRDGKEKSGRKIFKALYVNLMSFI
jgi:hypothetical protein